MAGRWSRPSPTQEATAPAAGATDSAIARALVERAARIDRKAELDRVLPKVAAILRTGAETARRLDAEYPRVPRHRPGLEESVAAPEAMRRPGRHPTAENYHVWRRRVKDLWFHVRLAAAAAAAR